MTPPDALRLFRAVSEAEYRDILREKRLRPSPNSMRGKWFALSAADARAWGALLYGEEQHYIVEGAVSAELGSTLYRVDYNLDGIGPAAYVDLAQLAMVSLLLEEV